MPPSHVTIYSKGVAFRGFVAPGKLCVIAEGEFTEVSIPAKSKDHVLKIYALFFSETPVKRSSSNKPEPEAAKVTATEETATKEYKEETGGGKPRRKPRTKKTAGR